MNIEASNKEIICYCFGHSVQDLRDDVLRNGRSLIMERIAAEKNAGACDCATRNPKGR
ncbi:MAG: hypothetical protein JRJ09_16580 [Deltaproteobacteria bacterium]|nr:hypothetical protein [Deltaproteobacteria bacterium]MBW2113196.1 hypothetical protein [Deltaproteobacteria bacterium]HDZ89159.1 BFD-like (2Fe-2S) protein [Deltaproteobacteria bacterium]